ncbi:MAG: FtsX-like permease family protein [Cyclobacteriaceae bacterium]
MQNQQLLPPKLPDRILKWLIKGELQEEILGDLHEYHAELLNLTPLKRRFFYWFHIFNFLRPFAIKNLDSTRRINNYGMLKNYFVTSLRFIKREKAFSLMNILGLALGIGCALVIYKIVDHETSFDKYHTNFQSIYRVVNEFDQDGGSVYFAGQPHAMAEGLRNDFGITAAMSYYDKDGLIVIEDDNGSKKRFLEKEGIAFVEPEFLELFDFSWIAGNATSALSDQGKVILTASSVEKYFGLKSDEAHNAIGKPIILENTKTLYVSAVVGDIPSTSDFPFTAIFHYQDQDAANQYFYEGKSWQEYNSATNCFVLLDKKTKSAELESQLEGYLAKYQPEDMSSLMELKLQPLAELHSSETVTRNYRGATVSDNKLIALGMVGLFLIITACINFINLATAQAVKRSKEVGVRKALGGNKGQLVTQFLTETFLITLIATLVGLLVANLLASQIENIFGYEINLALFEGLEMFKIVVAIILLVGFISGLYPAFILARMNPILAVKNSLNARQTSGFLSLRRALVVFQFAISQILIIGILILNLQMDYFLTKDLGFNDDSIIVVKLPESDSLKLDLLKNNLLANSQIEKVSFSTTGPLASWKVNNPIYHPSIVEDNPSGNLKNVDEDYLDLYELELVAGENYKMGDPLDWVVVNRKLTELIGFTNPGEALGERIKYGRSGREFTIVGVVEDFHAASLKQEMDYVIFANLKWNIYQAGIKFNANQTGYSDIKNLIGSIETHWTATYPEHVFDFEFYDEQLASLYATEQRISEVFKIIVAIAIIIGCLGLYGLVSFMSNQKTKEIGIRKVMGASIMSIWNIFSKEMILLLVIAFVLAAPVAYFAMNSWLENYTYRIEITPMVFIISILVSLAIALVTISYKSIRASRANPVLSLRDE